MMANSADGRGIQAGLQFASESEVETSSISEVYGLPKHSCWW